MARQKIIDNFESYAANSDLGGQGNWSIQYNHYWKVLESGGNKFANAQIIDSTKQATKSSITDVLSEGTYKFKMRKQFTSNDNQLGVYFKTGSAQVYVMMYGTGSSSQTIAFNGTVIATNKSTGVWYEIEIEIVGSQMRARVIGDTWSSWKAIPSGWGNVTQVVLNGRSSFHVDDIIYVDFSPSGVIYLGSIPSLNSAILNGQADTVSSLPITRRGFVFDKVSHITNPENVSPESSEYSDVKSSSGSFSSGSFNEEVDSLDSDTTYYVRVFAQNAHGFTYSDEFEFKTLSLPEPKIQNINPSVVATNTSPTITINGQNFQSGVEIFIDNILCDDIVFVDSNTITCKAPVSTTPKLVVLIVENPDTKKASSPFYYMEQIPPIPPEPSITASFSVKGVGIAK